MKDRTTKSEPRCKMCGHPKVGHSVGLRCPAGTLDNWRGLGYLETKYESKEEPLQIEVTPVQGTANQYTVTLAGQFRLAFSGTQDHATQVAITLRKQINRSGRRATLGIPEKNPLDTQGRHRLICK